MTVGAGSTVQNPSPIPGMSLPPAGQGAAENQIALPGSVGPTDRYPVQIDPRFHGTGIAGTANPPFPGMPEGLQGGPMTPAQAAAQKLWLQTVAWNQAAHAGDAAKLAAAVQAQHAASAASSSGGAAGGGGGGIPASNLPTTAPDINNAFAQTHAFFDQQRNQVTQKTMLQVAHLISQHAGAAAGVQGEGTKALGVLAALGKDATAQGALANKGVAGAYAGAQGADAKQYAALLADMKLHGADTSQLGTANLNLLGNLHAQGANQSALSQRLAQILGSDINDRTANARSATAGSLNDLRRVLEGAQFNAQQSGIDEGNKITNNESLARMQMQQQLAQEAAANARTNAQINAANARSSRSSSRSGGGRDANGLTPSNIIALLNGTLSHGKVPGKSAVGSNDYGAISGAFDKLLAGADKGAQPGLLRDFTGYMNDLQQNRISPQELLRNAQSRGINTGGRDSFGNVDLGGLGPQLYSLLNEAAQQKLGYHAATGETQDPARSAAYLDLAHSFLGGAY